MQHSIATGLSVDSFFPRSYDVASRLEREDFKLDFRRSAALKTVSLHLHILDALAEGNQADVTYCCNLDVLKGAMRALRRWGSDLDPDHLDEEDGLRIPTVEEGMWDAVVLYSELTQGQLCALGSENGGTYHPRRRYHRAAGGELEDGGFMDTTALRNSEFRSWTEFQGHQWGSSPAEWRQVMESMVKRVQRQFPQWSLEGGWNGRNVWIVKPGTNSKGSGVECMNTLPELLHHCDAMPNRIVQKYIEQPLLFQNRRKFDIRQWVLLRSVSPLRIFLFSDCYLRLCNSVYDVGSLRDRERHISNWQVNKHGKNAVDGACVPLSGFKAELCNITGRADFWEEDLLPQLRSIVVNTLRAVETRLEPRRDSFELYGFDIMVDESMKMWLLEVNLSPACESRVPFLDRMLDRMSHRLIQVAVLGQEAPDGQQPDWVLICDDAKHGNPVGMADDARRPVQDQVGLGLSVQGQGIKPPLARRRPSSAGARRSGRSVQPADASFGAGATTADFAQTRCSSHDTCVHTRQKMNSTTPRPPPGPPPPRCRRQLIPAGCNSNPQMEATHNPGEPGEACGESHESIEDPDAQRCASMPQQDRQPLALAEITVQPKVLDESQVSIPLSVSHSRGIATVHGTSSIANPMPTMQPISPSKQQVEWQTPPESEWAHEHCRRSWCVDGNERSFALESEQVSYAKPCGTQEEQCQTSKETKSSELHGQSFSFQSELAPSPQLIPLLKPFSASEKRLKELRNPGGVMNSTDSHKGSPASGYEPVPVQGLVSSSRPSDVEENNAEEWIPTASVADPMEGRKTPISGSKPFPSKELTPSGNPCGMGENISEEWCQANSATKCWEGDQENPSSESVLVLQDSEQVPTEPDLVPLGSNLVLSQESASSYATKDDLMPEVGHGSSIDQSELGQTPAEDLSQNAVGCLDQHGSLRSIELTLQPEELHTPSEHENPNPDVALPDGQMPSPVTTHNDPNSESTICGELEDSHIVPPRTNDHSDDRTTPRQHFSPANGAAFDEGVPCRSVLMKRSEPQVQEQHC